MRFKDEMKGFLSSAQGRLQMALLVLCVVCLVYLYAWL